jgi:hypothetical protein
MGRLKRQNLVRIRKSMSESEQRLELSAPDEQTLDPNGMSPRSDRGLTAQTHFEVLRPDEVAEILC